MLGERGQRLLNRGKNVMVRPVQLLSQYSLAGKAPDYRGLGWNPDIVHHYFLYSLPKNTYAAYSLIIHYL